MHTGKATLWRLRVGLARGVVVALLAAVGTVVAAQPAAAAAASSLEAGGRHTCAVVAGARVSCWGNNANGQLGDGTTTNRSSPVAVDTSGVLAGVTITQISAGDFHDLHEAIAEFVAARTGESANALYPQLLAGAATLSGRAALCELDSDDPDNDEPSPQRLREVRHRAYDALTSGLGQISAGSAAGRDR